MFNLLKNNSARDSGRHNGEYIRKLFFSPILGYILSYSNKVFVK